MSLLIDEKELVPIPSPHLEPRIAFQSLEPRKVNNLTLIDGKTFLSTIVAGDIAPAGAPDVGFFHQDTRFLSHLEFRIDGHRAVVLSSSTERTFSSQIELTTGNITLRDSFDLPENTVHIRREQVLGSDVFFDCFTFENFNQTPVEFTVELLYDADFVDVFQVRGVARAVQGQHFQPVLTESSICFYYRGRDSVMRKTLVEMSPKPDEIEARVGRWHLKLEPLKRIQIEARVTPASNRVPSRNAAINMERTLEQRRHAFNEWERRSTHFKTNNEVFDAALNTGIGDFHALQVPNGNEHIIAAGIPWFATIFGRDSIIAAYQSLCLNPQLAVDTLRVLARYQGTRDSAWQDEEPGKILHEYREGEMTLCGEMPFGPYYGSVDATPLFLILLSEAYNWTADDQLVRDLLPAAMRALEWLDRYGDRDGDGFVEYQRRSPKGLINQGWKDSWDANMHRDGKVAETPIALCEVQGYVYEAKYRMSSLLRTFGDTGTADRLRREATELAKRFDKAFWMPDEGFYAMALDAEKKPLRVISSNPGHLLFTRMLSRERARMVTQRFMQDDLYSGWGWRTLAMSERIFNPLSYHRGSVWPHDNSLIAHGMALNEYREPALQVLTSLYQAALEFRDYRLPELFCGVQRRINDEPVHYPVSCSPQAWASGAMFLILTSVLGIRPSAQRKELNIVNPELPDWLDHLHVRNLRIGNSRVGLDFTRGGTRTFCNVVDVEGDKLLVNVAFKR
ncbi:Amylo-alpha-1,6-glucosidase [Candidatus Koribacter versatilis Ellin345]|uniref:Amylo-alpha-1,6-glucosidase n=1 Tax=Koribacter versatilis (strain Ellin345) TaxID=204669 RepID=Q1ILJ0_KORVE|nr:glycogen debranching N-terminal domain-containing protein [Candidatus Koribacter versatilis]ABF42260.1 Amylo-alpha-1,6-glucosidase [Candidatus Koribacter versatilis Ellin345]